MKLLHVDSSILGAYSASRELTAEIVAQWVQKHPGTTVEHLDLAVRAPGHFGADAIAIKGVAQPEPTEAQRAENALSEQLVTQFLAADVIVSQKRVGGLQAVTAPYFPSGTIMITRLDNLSRYYQEGGRRRFIKEEPESDRIADYSSSNDAYVIEDYGMAAVSENIEFAA